jgi:hypothetical protein
MDRLASALGWLGLALCLAPVALVCLALMAVVAIANPIAGIIFAVIVFAGVSGIVSGRSE